MVSPETDAEGNLSLAPPVQAEQLVVARQEVEGLATLLWGD